MAHSELALWLGGGTALFGLLAQGWIAWGMYRSTLTDLDRRVKILEAKRHEYDALAATSASEHAEFRRRIERLERQTLNGGSES